MTMWWRTTAACGAWVALALVGFGGAAPDGHPGSAGGAESSVVAGLRLATCRDVGTGGTTLPERMVRTGRAGSMRAV